MEQLEALVGLHDLTLLNTISRLLVRKGYSVTKANTVDEMLRNMGVQENSTPTRFYDLYIMDANLGTRAYNFAPALKIYKLLKDKIQDEKAKFVAVTGNIDLVEDAKKAGIPCISKIDIIGYISNKL